MVVAAGETDCDPLALVEAVHGAEQVTGRPEGFVTDQLRLEESPDKIVDGRADRETLIGEPTVTVTEPVTLFCRLSLQVIVYIVVAAGETDCDPLVAVEAVHGAEQVTGRPEGFVTDQLKVDEPPDNIVDGNAERLTVRGLSTVTIAVVVVCRPLLSRVSNL
jgi:hypothetical protein